MSASPRWSFAVRTEGDALEIDMLDCIGEMYGPGAVTARNVIAALGDAKSAKRKVVARINSGGGEVFEGLAIYNALANHSADVEVVVLGLAASMASVIAMAGDTITMAPGSFMMIHNPWSVAMGDGDDLRNTADYLDRLRASLVSIYAARTKRAEGDIRALMDAETWMGADDAVAAKFADRVAKPRSERAPVALAFASLASFTKVPEELKSAIAAAQAAMPPPPETTPPPDGTAVTQPPIEEKEATMADEKKSPEPTNVISIARALELPAGATEQDAVSAAVRLRQLEVLVQALTGSPSTAEAVGSLRAMKVNADKFAATEAELVAVKAERDLQNFESLILRGVSEQKLVEPALQKLEREKFERKVKEGRGAEAVEELRGFLNVKAPDVRFSRSVSQPASTGGTPLLWNGKAFRDLKPAQRASLANEDPALYRAMKDDHEAAGAAA